MILLCMLTFHVLQCSIIILYLVKELLLYKRSNFFLEIYWPYLSIPLTFLQGYSSLAVALALPESARLVACERDERCLEVAKRYYRLAGVAHKVIIFSLLLHEISQPSKLITCFSMFVAYFLIIGHYFPTNCMWCFSKLKNLSLVQC
jgi:hypothetical protein